MTEAGKQRLRLLVVFLMLVSTLFSFESRMALGWKTGMALMPLAVNMAILFYLNRNKFSRFFYVVFGLFFLFHAVKNFLAR